MSPFLKSGVLIKANDIKKDKLFSNLQFQDLDFSEQIIGLGAYGAVKLATHKATGTKLALK